MSPRVIVAVWFTETLEMAARMPESSGPDLSLTPSGESWCVVIHSSTARAYWAIFFSLSRKSSLGGLTTGDEHGGGEKTELNAIPAQTGL